MLRLNKNKNKNNHLHTTTNSSHNTDKFQGSIDWNSNAMEDSNSSMENMLKHKQKNKPNMNAANQYNKNSFNKNKQQLPSNDEGILFMFLLPSHSQTVQVKRLNHLTGIKSFFFMRTTSPTCMLLHFIS